MKKEFAPIEKMPVFNPEVFSGIKIHNIERDYEIVVFRVKDGEDNKSRYESIYKMLLKYRKETAIDFFPVINHIAKAWLTRCYVFIKSEKAEGLREYICSNMEGAELEPYSSAASIRRTELYKMAAGYAFVKELCEKGELPCGGIFFDIFYHKNEMSENIIEAVFKEYKDGYMMLSLKGHYGLYFPYKEKYAAGWKGTFINGNGIILRGGNGDRVIRSSSSGEHKIMVEDFTNSGQRAKKDDAFYRIIDCMKRVFDIETFTETYNNFEARLDPSDTSRGLELEMLKKDMKANEEKRIADVIEKDKIKLISPYPASKYIRIACDRKYTGEVFVNKEEYEEKDSKEAVYYRSASPVTGLRINASNADAVLDSVSGLHTDTNYWIDLDEYGRSDNAYTLKLTVYADVMPKISVTAFSDTEKLTTFNVELKPSGNAPVFDASDILSENGALSIAVVPEKENDKDDIYGRTMGLPVQHITYSELPENMEGFNGKKLEKTVCAIQKSMTELAIRSDLCHKELRLPSEDAVFPGVYLYKPKDTKDVIYCLSVGAKRQLSFMAATEPEELYGLTSGGSSLYRSLSDVIDLDKKEIWMAMVINGVPMRVSSTYRQAVPYCGENYTSRMNRERHDILKHDRGILYDISWRYEGNDMYYIVGSNIEAHSRTIDCYPNIYCIESLNGTPVEDVINPAMLFKMLSVGFVRSYMFSTSFPYMFKYLRLWDESVRRTIEEPEDNDADEDVM